MTFLYYCSINTRYLLILSLYFSNTNLTFYFLQLTSANLATCLSFILFYYYIILFKVILFLEQF